MPPEPSTVVLLRIEKLLRALLERTAALHVDLTRTLAELGLPRAGISPPKE